MGSLGAFTMVHFDHVCSLEDECKCHLNVITGRIKLVDLEVERFSYGYLDLQYNYYMLLTFLSRG